MQRFVIALCGLLVLLGTGLVALRIVALGADEHDLAANIHDLVSTESNENFLQATLNEGARFVIELCTEGSSDPTALSGVSFDLWHLDEGELAYRRTIDASFLESMKTGKTKRCGILARSEAVAVGGNYELRVRTEAGDRSSSGASFVVRWMVRGHVGRADARSVWLLLLASTLLLLVSLIQRPSELGRPRPIATGEPSNALKEGSPTQAQATAASPARSDERQLGGLVIALIIVVAVLVFAPSIFGTDSLGAFLGALMLASVQASVAFGLGGGPYGSVLGLTRPRGGLLFLLWAPAAALALRQVGGLLQRVIPITAEAPIELFVSRPSGLIALGAVAVIVPLAEELFFRGLVYGRLDKAFGAAVAVPATATLFALMHLPQQWGAWGAFASVATTGLVLTLVRRYTHSTLVCALVHLLHNALITVFAIFGATSP